MKLPRDVSGKLLAETLCRSWRYRKVHQTGSHIILETEDPSHQRIAIPDHEALRIGTFNSILRAASAHKGVTREAILATWFPATPRISSPTSRICWLDPAGGAEAMHRNVFESN